MLYTLYTLCFHACTPLYLYTHLCTCIPVFTPVFTPVHLYAQGCLGFAGEHTIKAHLDTVGGAMLSGLREGVRVLDMLTVKREEWEGSDEETSEEEEEEGSEVCNGCVGLSVWGGAWVGVLGFGVGARVCEQWLDVFVCRDYMCVCLCGVQGEQEVLRGKKRPRSKDGMLVMCGE